MIAPRATMRVQFNKDFAFAAATELVPYFATLGVSHLYASPIMAARPGSTHGYDTIDPTRLNPELGSEEDFRRLIRALRSQAMGLILDIVPNHMAVGADNKWWMDVLQHGRLSRYAKFFDIDWDTLDPLRRGKVLLPVLGRPYGEVLGGGEIVVQSSSGAEPVVRYFDMRFPLSPETATVVAAEPAAFDPSSGQGRSRLHDLLEHQNYRLAWWRCANDKINWRRFFDINELAALRVEDDDVFEAVHVRILEYYAEGLIDGVRVDHVDGLARPGDYCRKLRGRLEALERKRPSDCPSGSAYLVVEKILARDERLPKTWAVDGTTGYDFMDEISLLQHAGSGEAPLSAFWTRVSGRSGRFADEEELARRQTLKRSFSSQVEGLVDVLYQLAQAEIVTRDFSREAIKRCVTELLSHFPVYRIYAQPNESSLADEEFFGRAMRRAETTCLPGDRPILKCIGDWLLGQSNSSQEQHLLSVAMTRFQQLSAPLCAKAVEDTAFYRYGQLISRNDVGFDAGCFASSVHEFHQRMRRRREECPNAMLATATHDHKRGEDVRARLAVLSECSPEWELAVAHWLSLARDLRKPWDERRMPSDGDLYILFQTVVGAWPTTLALSDLAGLKAYGERIAAWQQKALREAKLHSDWSVPNEAYEKAADAFVERLFSMPSDLLNEIAAFAERLMPAGITNSLAQVLIKLTAPGVPDIYQGRDFWDFSLVDPDNRVPVDFAARERALAEDLTLAVAADWRDGKLKQRVIERVLGVRHRLPDLLAKGNYVPLSFEGPLAGHVAAFARVTPQAALITVVSRFAAPFLRGAQLAIHASDWQDTRLIVPEFLCSSYSDQFATRDIAANGTIEVTCLLPRLPIGLFLGFL